MSDTMTAQLVTDALMMPTPRMKAGVEHIVPLSQAAVSLLVSFSVIGSLITVLVAIFALWPAYRQMNEMKRSSAVQAGQILRSRWKAAQAEINILMKGASVVGGISKHLELGKNDVDLEHRQAYHEEDDLPAIRDVLLPELEAVSVAASMQMRVDLPDLDRSAFDNAIDHIKFRPIPYS